MHNIFLGNIRISSQDISHSCNCRPEWPSVSLSLSSEKTDPLFHRQKRKEKSIANRMQRKYSKDKIRDRHSKGHEESETNKLRILDMTLLSSGIYLLKAFLPKTFGLVSLKSPSGLLFPEREGLIELLSILDWCNMRRRLTRFIHYQNKGIAQMNGDEIQS